MCLADDCRALAAYRSSPSGSGDMSNMPGVSLASSSISIFRASVRCSSLSLAAMASRSWPLSSDSISSSLYLAGSYEVRAVL